MTDNNNNNLVDGDAYYWGELSRRYVLRFNLDGRITSLINGHGQKAQSSTTPLPVAYQGESGVGGLWFIDPYRVRDATTTGDDSKNIKRRITIHSTNDNEEEDANSTQVSYLVEQQRELPPVASSSITVAYFFPIRKDVTKASGTFNCTYSIAKGKETLFVSQPFRIRIVPSIVLNENTQEIGSSKLPTIRLLMDSQTALLGKRARFLKRPDVGNYFKWQLMVNNADAGLAPSCLLGYEFDRFVRFIVVPSYTDEATLGATSTDAFIAAYLYFHNEEAGLTYKVPCQTIMKHDDRLAAWVPTEVTAVPGKWLIQALYIGKGGDGLAYELPIVAGAVSETEMTRTPSTDDALAVPAYSVNRKNLKYYAHNETIFSGKGDFLFATAKDDTDTH